MSRYKNKVRVMFFLHKSDIIFDKIDNSLSCRDIFVLLFIKIKTYYVMRQNEIHIGILIKNKLKEDQHSVSWLAEMIHCKRSNIYKIFDKQSIDTAQLLRISLALETNFFSCYTDVYQNSIDSRRERTVRHI